MRMHGFTMLEILVVIGIVGLLMAAMFAALGKIRQRTNIGQARNLVEKCASSLETYRLSFREYPDPADTPSKSGAECLHYYLATAFSKETPLKTGEVAAAINVGPLVDFEERDLRVQAGKTEVVDPWGTPLQYKLGFVTDANNLKIMVPQVYSCGINRADDSGAGDDISVGK